MKVDEKRARAISGESGAGILRFIPYWRYHYRSSGQKGYGNQVVTFNAEKKGAINAINGAANLRTRAGPGLAGPYSAVVLQPMVKKDEAEEKPSEPGSIEESTQEGADQAGEGRYHLLRGEDFKPEEAGYLRRFTSSVHVPVWELPGGRSSWSPERGHGRHPHRADGHGCRAPLTAL